MWFKDEKALKEPEAISLRWAVGHFQCFSWNFDDKALDKHATKDAVVDAWLKGDLPLEAIVNKERFEQMKRESIAKQPKPAYVI